MLINCVAYQDGKKLADIPIVVEADYIPRIQEVQASIYHTMREALGVAGDAG